MDGVDIQHIHRGGPYGHNPTESKALFKNPIRPRKFVSAEKPKPSAGMDFGCSDVSVWKEAVGSYNTRIRSLGKPDLVGLDDFYRTELPLLLRKRDPSPYITQPELYKLMQWKLARGKWRPRLLDFISSLDETQVESASRKAFQSLPNIQEAVTELSTLKGVGPATASAVLAAYAPDIAPFMSDEAMVAALGSSKDYSLKQYLIFAEKLQTKAKEVSVGGDILTPSDVEMALWSSAMGAKSASSSDGLSLAGSYDEPKETRPSHGGNGNIWPEPERGHSSMSKIWGVHQVGLITCDI